MDIDFSNYIPISIILLHPSRFSLSLQLVQVVFFFFPPQFVFRTFGLQFSEVKHSGLGYPGDETRKPGGSFLSCSAVSSASAIDFTAEALECWSCVSNVSLPTA